MLIIDGAVPASNTIAVSVPEANGDYEVVFQGTPATQYQVEVSSNLEQWAVLATITSDANGMIYHLDTDLGSVPIRYYRVMEVSAP